LYALAIPAHISKVIKKVIIFYGFRGLSGKL